MTQLSPEARQILLKMKARLSTGWTQGELEKGEEVCLFGAAGHAAPQFLSIYTGPPIAAPIHGRAGGVGKNEVCLRMLWQWEHKDGTPTPLGEAIAALAEAAGVEKNDLALWNDEPGRTAADVVGLIDRALAQDAAPNPDRGDDAASPERLPARGREMDARVPA